MHSQASHPWLRASLIMRAVMGLTVVYLMIGKPPLNTSLLVTAGAVAVGLAVSMFHIAASRRSSANTRGGIRTMP